MTCKYNFNFPQIKTLKCRNEDIKEKVRKKYLNRREENQNKVNNEKWINIWHKKETTRRKN
jgi:hypothetical protein